jgi:hypothetical protein
MGQDSLDTREEMSHFLPEVKEDFFSSNHISCRNPESAKEDKSQICEGTDFNPATKAYKHQAYKIRPGFFLGWVQVRG